MPTEPPSSSGGWNRTSASRFRAWRRDQPRPPRSSASDRLPDSGRRIRTSISRFKVGGPAVSRFPRAPRGSRTRLSGVEGRRLTARPGTRMHYHVLCQYSFIYSHRIPKAEEEGVEPSRLIAHPTSNRAPSPIGLLFRPLRTLPNISQLQGRESNPHARGRPINSGVRLPFRHPGSDRIRLSKIDDRDESIGRESNPRLRLTRAAPDRPGPRCMRIKASNGTRGGRTLTRLVKSQGCRL